jgi:hypothetical protein
MSKRVPITPENLSKVGIIYFATESQFQYVSDFHKETIIKIIDLIGDMSYFDALRTLESVDHVLKSIINTTHFR